MTDILALAFLLIAVPGLLLGRFGPAGVRLLTLLSLTALFVAVLDVEQTIERQVPARIALVGTGDPASPELQRRIAGAQVEVEVVRDNTLSASSRPSPEAGLRERLARGALRSGPRARELLLVWSGPLAVQEPVLMGHGLTALVPDAVLDLDPEQLQAWLVGEVQVDRPAGLQVRLADAHRALRAEVVVSDPAGELLRQEVRLDPGSPVVELPMIPTRAGDHSVVLRTTVDGIAVERRGSFAVAGPDPVMVVGAGAEQLAGALRVQGMAVAASPVLPDDLSGLSALVLLERSSPEEQQRLKVWLEGGGGLFVVGGEGGALPEQDEPLHELLPVVCLPREPATANTGESEGAESGGQEPPEKKEESSDVPPPPPGAPEGQVGETQLDPETAEVDRRLVGMVLVVDRSMSMGDRVEGGQLIKMDYAKRSALATAKSLQDGDELGIVTFGNKGYGRTELPMTVVTDMTQIEERISRLAHARESTYLTSGLQRAGDLLERSRAAVRFIVVITDGVFQDEDLYVTSNARRLAANGINVSLIQIVGDSGEGGALKSKKVTDAGQGTYMRTQSAREVPRLVVAEVGRALGRVGREPTPLRDADAAGAEGESLPDPTATKPPEPDPPTPAPPTPEPPETPQRSETRLTVRAVTDSVLLEPRLPEGFPDLLGMDAVRGRPDAHVLLVGGDEGLPVLSFANRGVGRIAVWASDLLGTWGQPWRDAPEFSGRLATWVQSLFPPRPRMPGDLLTATGLQPVVPTARDVAALARLATGPVLRESEFEPPGPRTLLSSQGMAQELAIAAALALLVLAVGEYLLLRWKARWS